MAAFNPARIERLGTCVTCGRGYGSVADMKVHLDSKNEYEPVNDHGVVTARRAKIIETRIRNGTYQKLDVAPKRAARR